MLGEGDEELKEKIQNLMIQICQEEMIADKWKEGLIVPIQKTADLM